MPIRFPHASFVILFGLAATGCAAPVKALMQLASPQATDETPAPASGEAAKTPLQQALEKRAAALRDPRSACIIAAYRECHRARAPAVRADRAAADRWRSKAASTAQCSRS